MDDLPFNCYPNVFIVFAWYGHLKDKGLPLWKAILISWGTNTADGVCQPGRFWQRDEQVSTQVKLEKLQ
jgi:uncharacterized protein (DUF486 family)